MIKAIKKFLTDRGYYSIPKPTRHIVMSGFSVLFFAGITQMIVGYPIWPLAGLIVFILSLSKEIFIDKGNVHQIVKDMTLNIFGIVIGMFPYYI